MTSSDPSEALHLPPPLGQRDLREELWTVALLCSPALVGALFWVLGLFGVELIAWLGPVWGLVAMGLHVQPLLVIPALVIAIRSLRRDVAATWKVAIWAVVAIGVLMSYLLLASIGRGH